MPRRNSDDESEAHRSPAERAAEQFYGWEARGRGWLLWDDPVELDPPFKPFFWRPVDDSAGGAADDGRKHTPVSGVLQWLHERLMGPPSPVSQTTEEEDERLPEVCAEDEAWVEWQMSLPQDASIARDVAQQLLLSLSSCRRPLSFEVIGLPNSIAVQIVCSQVDRDEVREQIEAHCPEAVVIDGDGTLATHWDELDGDETAVAEFGLAREFMLPLASPRTLAVDALVGIVGALSGVAEGEVGLLQVLFKPVRHPWATSILRSVAYADGTDLFAGPWSVTASAKEKVARPLYATVLRVACRSQAEGRAWALARRLTGALATLSDPAGNELFPLDNEGYPSEEHADDVPRRRSRRSGMILNSDELVALVHPPSATVRSLKLQRDLGHTKAAPACVRSGTTLLGENEHAGRVTKVYLGPEQRLQHTHVIGASGTGKSTFLLNLILQDIRRGEGVGVLDPHGDLIDAVLQRVSEERISDVVLLDPADEAYPVGFNLLDARSDTERNLLASDLVAVFRRLSTSWGDQMNAVLANAVLSVLESDRGGTLADVRRFLVEKPFREEFLESVRDEGIVYYWRKEYPLLTGRPQAPVLTRLDSFLRPKTIRRMVCQRENKLDVADIMDRGRIFLARLSHGAIGEENAHLLGALLVAKFHQMAMGRQSRAETDRRPFWLYIDEFQHFATPSMASLMASVRKYKLGLTLAHQELYQMESRSPEVASAVLGNAHTRVCFRVGDHDARKLESGFASFDAQALQNLGVGGAVCRVERAGFDFNLRTPPAPHVNEAVASAIRARVIAQSRHAYATPLEIAEEDWRKSVPATPDPPPSTPMAEPAPQPSSQPAASLPVVPPKPVRRERPSAAMPKVPAEEVMPGRGGPDHKYLQHLIKQWGDGMEFLTTIEKTILDGQGSVDVALEKPNRRIACLVSVTTSDQWELGSIRKCLAAGFERVALVSADDKHLSQLRAAIESQLTDDEKPKVGFFLPEALFAFIQELEVGDLERERTVRGYKVKSSYRSLDGAEGEARRSMISRVVADSIRRIAPRKKGGRGKKTPPADPRPE